MGTDNLAQKAAARHGVFTYREAMTLGIPDGTFWSRLDCGRYVKIYPGVYAIAGSADTRERRMVAAVKSLPDLAAISHRTAAELWGLTRRGFRRVDVVTTRWDRTHRSDFSVHESLDLAPGDVVVVDGVPVTTAVRTVVDLGAVNRWMVESALEQGIRAGLFRLADVEAFVRRVARRGRRGVGVIRPLLEERKHWDTATESALEDLFRKRLRDAYLPDPVPQYVVRGPRGEFIARADFAYPDAHLLIELDSEAYHMDRLTFRRDRSKQNAAVISGWTVLRYTWWDLKKDPGIITSQIRSALEVPA